MAHSVRLLAAFVLILCASRLSSAEELPLRMAINHYFPPFGWAEGGKLLGFDVDLANALCKTMSRTCRIQAVGYGDRVPGLKLGRFDVLVTPTTGNDPWVKSVILTRSYGNTSSVFLAPEAFGPEVSARTVAGRRIGVKRNSPHETFMRERFGDAAKVETFISIGHALRALGDGSVDLLFVPTFSAVGYLRKSASKGIGIVGAPVTAPPFGASLHIAVRPKETALRDALDRALSALTEDGTHARLVAKYFPPMVAPTMAPVQSLPR